MIEQDIIWVRVPVMMPHDMKARIEKYSRNHPHEWLNGSHFVRAAVMHFERYLLANGYEGKQ